MTMEEATTATENPGERVLIVEDDPSTRTGLAELVQAWGFQTDEASDGEEGFRKVTSFRPAIIVSDLVMPRMGGHDLLRTLKDQLSDITFILLTAQGTIESAVEAIKDGAYDYLSKPVDPQRLQDTAEQGGRTPGDAARGQAAAAAAPRAGQLRPHRRQQPRHSIALSRHRAGGADRGVGAHLGRVGNRQGARRADHPRAEPARLVPVRRHQLRRDSRDAARERDLRPREGRVHRRARSADRRVRAGAPRHALPRRDRRDGAGDAGQAAARAAGAHVPPAGRTAGADRGRPRDCGDQPRSRRKPCATAGCARTSTTA